MKKTALIIISLVSAAAGLRAQSPSAIDQVDAIQQRGRLQQNADNAGVTAPELYPGESSDVGPQRVLTLRPRHTYFAATADVQYLHTDNMFQTAHERQDADVLVSAVQVALAPTAYALGGGEFAPRFGYRHEWYDYGLVKDGTTVQAINVASVPLSYVTKRLNDFDFNSQTFFMAMDWGKDNWVLSAGVDFCELLTAGQYNEFYREYVPRWGVQRNIPFAHNATLAIGYEGDIRFTHADQVVASTPTDLNDRTDNSLFVVFTQPIGKHAAIQPFYRAKYTVFNSGPDRDDYTHEIGAAFYWHFTPQIGARAFASFTRRDSSNSGVGGYDNFNTGVGLNLTFRF